MVTTVKLGCTHPLSVLLYHLQEDSVFQGVVGPALLCMDHLLGAFYKDSNLSSNHRSPVWMVNIEYSNHLRYRRKDIEAAEARLVLLRVRSERALGPDHLMTRKMLLLLADIHFQSGRHEVAKVEYEMVIERGQGRGLASLPHDPYVGIHALSGLARLHEDIGVPALSTQYWQRALVLVEARGAWRRTFIEFFWDVKEGLLRQGFRSESSLMQRCQELIDWDS